MTGPGGAARQEYAIFRSSLPSASLQHTDLLRERFLAIVTVAAGSLATSAVLVPMGALWSLPQATLLVGGNTGANTAGIATSVITAAVVTS